MNENEIPIMPCSETRLISCVWTLIDTGFRWCTDKRSRVTSVRCVLTKAGPQKSCRWTTESHADQMNIALLMHFSQMSCMYVYVKGMTHSLFYNHLSNINIVHTSEKMTKVRLLQGNQNHSGVPFNFKYLNS